jgi:hypothetical protein
MEKCLMPPELRHEGLVGSLPKFWLGKKHTNNLVTYVRELANTLFW